MNQTHAETIARAALDRVDPEQMIEQALSIENNHLVVSTENERHELDLAGFRRIVVLGAGKATAKMARAVEQVLGNRISEGVISVKYGHTAPLSKIGTIEAGHPLPDENSIRAAQEQVRIASEADEATLCIVLISGGGSALLTLPYSEGEHNLTLSDMQETTTLLLSSGATIQEINTIRKHISAIKGGRLAAHAAPATVLSLILSDVVGDNLESIASGLTVPDPDSGADAWDVVLRYQLQDRIPSKVAGLLQACKDNPKLDTPKPTDPTFNYVHNVLIGTNAQALEAARVKAEELGYNTLVLSSQITGEAREIAKFYSAIAVDLVAGAKACALPACVLAGGETTVTIRGTGKGGRNQEMAVAFLAEIARRPQAYDGVTFLSAATDGNDGPTDAAGGFASSEILATARSASLSVQDALAANNSYEFLDGAGALYKTGPTNTNVCDLQILLVEA
ncbi:MAG: glycerate kinase [Spirochaeta sp.]|nr:glycerate kinase [Spirochaeta sp.]